MGRGWPSSGRRIGTESMKRSPTGVCVWWYIGGGSGYIIACVCVSVYVCGVLLCTSTCLSTSIYIIMYCISDIET